MPLTVNDILTQAGNLIGIASAGNELGPDDARVLLIELNAIRNRWALELQNFGVFDHLFTASAVTDSVTMGVGGDIPERPAVLDQVVVNSGALNWPIPLLTLEEYRQISVPATGGVPSGAYADTGYPLQTIRLFPTMQPGWGIRVMGKAYPTEYTNIANPVVDAPELHQALILNLAVDAAPMFGQVIAEGVQQRAHATLKHVRNNNFVRNMKAPRGGIFDSSGGGNIWGGFQ